MVQLPEKTLPESQAYKNGFGSIAEIGRERIRRVVKRIRSENKDKLKLEKAQDIGFR